MFTINSELKPILFRFFCKITINSDLITDSIRNFLQNYSKFRIELQNLPCNPSASFGIGQGVMVVDQIVAAGCRYGMQLVVG